MSFDQWLAQRCIDCNELTRELEIALHSQYEADCQRSAPPSEVLLVPVYCQWPSRGYWVATGSM